MKSVEQWFKEILPENVCLLATWNTTYDKLSIETNTFKEALSGAFLWAETEQGYKFWKKISKKYADRRKRNTK